MCVANPFIRKNKTASFDKIQSKDTAPSHFQEWNNGAIQFFSEPFPTHLPERKQRSKRVRQPQKPGKTAKNQERQFVVHNYHDRATSPSPMLECSTLLDTNNSKISFPLKLHRLLGELSTNEWSQVISWSIHGRCFLIHQPKLFTDVIMPKYFRQSKLTSFQRQLNLYGFQRITRGRDAAGYYHEYFLQSRPDLCHHMTRVRVKGTRYKAAGNPSQEPDFYAMPFASQNLSAVAPVLSTLSVFSSVSYQVSQVSYQVSQSPGVDHYSQDDPIVSSSATIGHFYPLPLQQTPANEFGCEAASVLSVSTDKVEQELSDFLAADEMDDILFQEQLNADDTLASMIEKLLED